MDTAPVSGWWRRRRDGLHRDAIALASRLPAARLRPLGNRQRCSQQGSCRHQALPEPRGGLVRSALAMPSCRHPIGGCRTGLIRLQSHEDDDHQTSHLDGVSHPERRRAHQTLARGLRHACPEGELCQAIEARSRARQGRSGASDPAPSGGVSAMNCPDEPQVLAIDGEGRLQAGTASRANPWP